MKKQTHTHRLAPGGSYSDRTSDCDIHSADEAPCSSEQQNPRKTPGQMDTERLRVQKRILISTIFSAECIGLQALHDKSEESRCNSLPDSCGDTCTSPLRRKSFSSS